MQKFIAFYSRLYDETVLAQNTSLYWGRRFLATFPPVTSESKVPERIQEQMKDPITQQPHTGLGSLVPNSVEDCPINSSLANSLASDPHSKPVHLAPLA